MKNLKHLVYLLFALLLIIAACKEDEEEIPGQPPTVSAGPDLMGTVDDPVNLNGTATDPDGDQLTIGWKIVTSPDGSSATISNPTSLNTSFTPDVAGTYTLKLTADDGNYDPVSDEVTVTVEESVGEPPVASIVDKNGSEINADNENNTVPVGSSYLLDASNSYDPDEDDLTFAWEVTSAPENADYTFTESADKTQATFAPKTTGEYNIKVTVTDPDENTATAEVTLTATAESILITENVDADTTWIDLFADPAMPDYIVKNDIAVNASLTLQPGVVVHLDEDVVMTVESGGGAMIAEGTQEKPITFTSSDEAGQIYWGGLLFKSSNANNSLIYVNARYGGGLDRIIYESGSYRPTSIAIATDGKLKISNSVISNSEGDGLFVQGSNSLIELENNTFRNNGGYAMSVSINQAGVISATNIFEDNGDTPSRENLVRIYDSSLETDQEWIALGGGASYIFVGNTDINAKLTIGAGAKLEFNEGVYMSVESEGSLAANGTEGNEVIFTSTKIGEGQNWGGILVSSSSANNVLDHVKIMYAGGFDRLIYDIGAYKAANLAVEQNARISITNTEIANSKGYGVYVHQNGELAAFANNNFHDNQKYPIWLSANQVGMIDVNTTFTNNKDNVVAIFESTFNDEAKYNDESNPRWIALNGEARYLITGGISVESDLNIAPGAYFMVGEEIVFDIASSGSLKAIGNADSTIVFTAYKEDGNNNWGGILILSDNGNEIRFAKVSYAGGFDRLVYDGSYFAGNIALEENAILDLYDTEVSNSKTYGLVVDSDATVNDLTSADTDAATTVANANTFSSNASGDVNFIP